MKCQVIIHTRTKQCDFPSQFAVSPSVDGSSIEKIRRQILSSTSGFADDLRENEVRYLIYSCGDYVIAGIVSFLKNFADSNTDDERFFNDINNRRIFAFIGLAIKKEEGNHQIPIINKKILWDIFKTHISKIWERTVIDPQTGVEAELDLENETPSKPSAKYEIISDVTVYVSGSDDSSLFLYWLSQALNGDKNVSFCSNITDFCIVKQFNVITTKPNIIQRMRMVGMEVSPARNQNHPSLSPQYDSMPEKKNTEFNGQDEFRQNIEQHINNYCSGAIIRDFDNNGTNYKIISISVRDKKSRSARSAATDTTDTPTTRDGECTQEPLKIGKAIKKYVSNRFCIKVTIDLVVTLKVSKE